MICSEFGYSQYVVARPSVVCL